jgi:hypothetical protein
LCALPGVALLTPTIYLLFTAMGLNALAAVGVLVVMVVGLLIPQLAAVTATRRWLLPAGAALAGLALLSGGSLARGFDDTHPRPDNIFYALDANSGQAVWASGDRAPDPWTAQFLKRAERGALVGYVPQQLNNMLINTAPALPLSPPAIELLDDSTAGGTRSLKLRVTSPRMAQVLTVYVDSDAAVQEATLDGRRLDDAPARWRMSYYAPPAEGFELTLRVKPSEPLKLRVMDRSYGLPDVAGAGLVQRPAWSMPSASLLYSDQSLVNKSYTF